MTRGMCNANLYTTSYIDKTLACGMRTRTRRRLLIYRQLVTTTTAAIISILCLSQLQPGVRAQQHASSIRRRLLPRQPPLIATIVVPKLRNELLATMNVIITSAIILNKMFLGFYS